MILQSFLSALVYILLLAIVTAIARAAKVPRAVAFPIVFSILTFFLYLCSFFPTPAFVAIAISSIGTILTSLTLKKIKIELPAVPKGYYILIFIVSMLLIIPRLSFLTLPVSDEIRFPYIGDETKHIGVLTSIAANQTFPPRFPYDPTFPFPYYYFYYLVPGAILKLFPHATAGIIWVAHVFFTQVAVFTVFATLICAVAKKSWIRSVGIGLMIFGSSYKIVPKLFHWWGVTEPHIEHWWQIPGDPIFGKPGLIGWQITHPMTLAIWTPQHQWAAALAAIVFLIIMQKKQKSVTFLILGLLLAVLVGTSAFVAATLFAILAAYLLISTRRIQNFLPWIVTGAFAVLFAFPLLRIFAGNQARITFSPYLPYLPHLPNLLGIPLFYIIETGVVIPVIVYLLFFAKKFFKDRTFLFLGLATFLPLILPRLVTSQFMNDIGMRIPILYTVFAPVLVVFLLDRIKLARVPNKIIKFILIVSIAFGFFAGMLELYFQSSKVETYPESLSSIYKVTARFTNPADVILVNDPYIADRMPLFSSRMTLKPTMPFSMDVYVPKRDDHGLKYPQAICPIYSEFRRKLPMAPVVYVELGNVAALPCEDVANQKKSAAILFSSPAVTLYRL